MNDIIEAIYPTIRKLARKIDSANSYCGYPYNPKITVNWITQNADSDWPTKHGLTIDTEGIRFHQEYSTHHDYRMATQNVEWTDPDLLEKITNFMAPPHRITPDTTTNFLLGKT